MEFKNREEAAFWQLLVLSQIKEGQGDELDMRRAADKMVELYRTRMEKLHEKEAVEVQDAKDFINSIKKGLETNKGPDPMKLVPPLKPPGGEDSN